ncbi:MAG: twin-arginine translocase subunit TatC [Candidatus Poseidoniaceae archaeon]|nr:twin-arginine translocase subunit TatC [Candidatus Poseidoniaceae archaeon]
MQSSQGVEEQFADLMDSPGGKLLLDVRNHIIKRMPMLAGAFFVGLVIGYPAASVGVEWLVSDATLAPDDTEIAVLSPVEFIAIKIRFSAAIGILAVAALLIGDAALGAARSSVLQARLAEADIRIPKPERQLVLTMLSVPLLAAAGLYYAYELLLPLLLEYLAQDAASVGLKTEWRLSSYIGFIINMSVASMLGFQTPLLTLLVLRSGAVDRSAITGLRRHIWFASCVFGALLSPPDPLSLFLVALPVITLFELALIVDAILPRRT